MLSREFFIGLISGSMLAIVSAVIGQLVMHPFITRRDKKNRQSALWNSECLMFKIPFIDALADLEDIEKPYSVSAILGKRFPSHQTAYVRFSLALTGDTKRGLEEAWKAYKDYHHQYKEEVIRPLGVDIPESEQKRLVLERINRLLSFAEET